MPAKSLIVAYGNPLRSDDGVAWHAADALEDKYAESDIEIIRLHQLAPEVADSLKQRKLVIFVDAACLNDAAHARPGEVRVREISAGETQQRPPEHFSHVYSPEKVLTFACELYKATPEAFVVTITGEDFGHGDHLSPTVTAALPELVVTITRLVEESSGNSTA
jgi:hydrogenase maturation protease